MREVCEKRAEAGVGEDGAEEDLDECEVVRRAEKGLRRIDCDSAPFFMRVGEDCEELRDGRLEVADVEIGSSELSMLDDRAAGWAREARGVWLDEGGLVE